VVETETDADFENLRQDLNETFGNQIDLEKL